MLNFPEGFFEEEVRDGFTVPSLMKHAWAAELQIYEELREFLEAHQLTYFAEVGTLLGAVRHRGFIPWDDDLDLGMPREDYRKLQELADELPEPLRLKSFYTQESFRQFHSVVSNSRAERLDWDEERVKRYHGCPFIVGIDIFPLDFIPADPKEKQLQRLLYNMAYSLAFRYEEEKKEAFAGDLATLQQYTGAELEENRPVKVQLYEIADRIAMRCPEEAAAEFDYFPRQVIHEDPWLRQKSWYRSFVPAEFEMTTIPIPIDAVKALDRFYPDWRTPIQRPSEHGYPFYKGQLEYFTLAGFSDKIKEIVRNDLSN